MKYIIEGTETSNPRSILRFVHKQEIRKTVFAKNYREACEKFLKDSPAYNFNCKFGLKLFNENGKLVRKVPIKRIKIETIITKDKVVLK